MPEALEKLQFEEMKKELKKLEPEDEDSWTEEQWDVLDDAIAKVRDADYNYMMGDVFE